MSAAADCGQRVTLAGEVWEPAFPGVAAAVAAGEVSARHVSVIGATLARVPAEFAWDAVPVAETLLVEGARRQRTQTPPDRRMAN